MQLQKEFPSVWSVYMVLFLNIDIPQVRWGVENWYLSSKVSDGSVI
jgi:hypothetical protein